MYAYGWLYNIVFKQIRIIAVVRQVKYVRMNEEKWLTGCYCDLRITARDMEYAGIFCSLSHSNVNCPIRASAF
jgi:hypothetical protein